MSSLLLYGIMFAMILGSRHAVGAECNVTAINECIGKFHLYEEKTFPFYGNSETELAETCLDMESTLQCLLQFDSCEHDAACDEECQKSLRKLYSVKSYSALGDFFQQLCEGENPFRTKYLEHANCFNELLPVYGTCYNTSQSSLVHIFSPDGLLTVKTICCYYTWLRECYFGLTSWICGTDAANFVSDAFKVFRGFFGARCGDEATCQIPPLPDRKKAVSHTNKSTEPASNESADGDGSRQAVGAECSVAEMNKCIDKYHFYEDRTFPFYGNNETGLAETCSHMESALPCVSQFESCKHDAACDEKCKKSLQHIYSLRVNSGLVDFFLQLCEGENPVRTKYLEHANCFNGVAPVYEVCYNTSRSSLEYIDSNKDIRGLESVCCLYTWFRGCYLDATSYSCGTDAANFVSEALKIIRARTEAACVDKAICQIPPLPDTPLGKKDVSHTNESTDPPSSKSPVGFRQRACLHSTLITFVAVSIIYILLI